MEGMQGEDPAEDKEPEPTEPMHGQAFDWDSAAGEGGVDGETNDSQSGEELLPAPRRALNAAAAAAAGKWANRPRPKGPMHKTTCSVPMASHAPSIPSRACK
eukprot:jgi/Mesvir1/23453/Mv22302-RA.1